MSKLYLIPNRKDMERMCSLAAEYGCAFEYNDFYVAKVMDDSERREEIIADYRARICRECISHRYHAWCISGCDDSQ